MAHISKQQSIEVLPSNFDRHTSDKGNLNLCFLGWWTVFALRSKSSGLCWNRLAEFSFPFRSSSTNRSLGGITSIVRIVLAKEAYHFFCKPIGSFCALQIN